MGVYVGGWVGGWACWRAEGWWWGGHGGQRVVQVLTKGALAALELLACTAADQRRYGSLSTARLHSC